MSILVASKVVVGPASDHLYKFTQWTMYNFNIPDVVGN